MMSEYRNSRAAAWSPSRRFDPAMFANKEQPGPGQYEPRDYADGNYVLSKFRSSGTRRFGTAARLQLKGGVSGETPGPGHYRPPSDFGYLDLEKFSHRASQQSPRGGLELKPIQKVRENSMDAGEQSQNGNQL
jgi:hypothetical protein